MKILLSLVLLVLAGSLYAQEPLPRLEVGVGMLALDSPDYRGSSESDTYLLPAPYIKYRGERLREGELRLDVSVSTRYVRRRGHLR